MVLLQCYTCFLLLFLFLGYSSLFVLVNLTVLTVVTRATTIAVILITRTRAQVDLSAKDSYFLLQKGARDGEFLFECDRQHYSTDE